MHAIPPFIACDLFHHDVDVGAAPFVVRQRELLLHPTDPPRPVFRGVDVEYRCAFRLQAEEFDPRRPFIIIPSRNNVALLRHTLANLLDKRVDAIGNVMVVDDRSTEDYPSLVDGMRRVSYLRVDNEKGFNYSMLCNIAAYVAGRLGCGEIILWNNDVWVDDPAHLERVIRRHREDGAVVSGTKLLYPLRSFDGDTADTANICRKFPALAQGRWRGTVQFGGASWVERKGPIRLVPTHARRFAAAADPHVNDDRAEVFVTGAFQLIRLEWYLKRGGLNPSLAATLQDVDLCLRAAADGDRVMYYGRDGHLWHDESLTLEAEGTSRQGLQFRSDRVLFGKLWNDRMAAILR